jgi:energy-converting hydrogenase Eha subunit C
MDDRDPGAEDAALQRRPFNKWLIIALVVAVLAGVVLASTLLDNRWSGGGEKSDSATDA